MLDFESILTIHGFTSANYDFNLTIIGWSYDLEFAFFDSESCFDINRCKIIRKRDNPNAFIRCDLVTHSGDISTAIQFFDQQWRNELRYENPVREIVDKQIYQSSATIHVLTISQHNAMTILLTTK